MLFASIHDGYRHCTTEEQVEQLITEVMTTLDSGDPRRPLVCGEVAALYFADQPLTAETFSEPPFTWTATHELVVAINRATGLASCGGTPSSCPATRPPADPAVLGDPFIPSWDHPRYAIPLADVEAAVREFCFGGSSRPVAVAWSDDGARHDRPYLSSEEYLAVVSRRALPGRDSVVAAGQRV